MIEVNPEHVVIDRPSTIVGQINRQLIRIHNIPVRVGRRICRRGNSDMAMLTDIGSANRLANKRTLNPTNYMTEMLPLLSKCSSAEAAIGNRTWIVHTNNANRKSPGHQLNTVRRIG